LEDGFPYLASIMSMPSISRSCGLRSISSPSCLIAFWTLGEM
jgi:hypothetical protein